MSNAVSSPDLELQAVAAAMVAADPDGQRTAQVLRETIDQLYDGQRTGRYRWDQLFKTEKTHCGTLVEINMQREFRFVDGQILDFSIAGVEVDCKYSQTVGGWMIPPETIDRLCLVISAKDDADPRWSMGLVRTSVDHLGAGGNRDAKKSLNSQGRSAIFWLFQTSPLPANVLLQLDIAVVTRMMAIQSGASRVRELFRVAQRKIVGRSVVATVGQQKDYMKRVRANGGARSALRSEGLLVLGQYHSHVRIATELGLVLPGPGDSISVRVSKSISRGPGVAEIDGTFWRVATDDDPIELAPILPKPTKREAGEEDGP